MEVREPKRSSFEEFGAVWSRSPYCCSRSASSQRVENFQRIASLCNFCSRSTQSQSRKIFQRIASKVTYCSRSNPKNHSAPPGRQADREQITSCSRSISGISKNPAYKLSDFTHSFTKITPNSLYTLRNCRYTQPNHPILPKSPITPKHTYPFLKQNCHCYSSGTDEKAREEQGLRVSSLLRLFSQGFRLQPCKFSQFLPVKSA